MKKIFGSIVLVFVLGTAPGGCGELSDLFSSVAALNIERQGYVLCVPLTEAQQAYARENSEEANSKKVYRFRDKNLNIVADQETHRVLVMFEQFDSIAQPGVQTLLGDLFLAYGDPTVSAHDMVVYWAWGKKEKFTADQYAMAREKKKQLKIFATVKLNSEVKIMDRSQGEKKGRAYYIISSDPLLRFFKDE